MVLRLRGHSARPGRGKVTRIAFGALVGFLLFIYFEPTYLIPGLAALRPALLMSLVALVAALASGARLPKGPQNWLLAAFTLWAAIASLTALSTDRSAERFPVVFKAVALYAVVAMVVRSRDRIVQFANINVVLGAIVSLVTILTSRAGIRPLGGGDMYRLVNYFGGIGDDPNEFGAFMLALLPMPMLLMSPDKSKLKRLALAIVALSFLLCAMRTRSRGAFLGLMAMAPLLWWENRRKAGHMLLIAGMAIYAYTHTHAGYWDRIATAFSEDAIEADFSASSRLHQQNAAIDLMVHRPLFGVGPGNFVIGKIELLDEDPEDKMTWVAPHNAYLGLGSEVGVPGLLAFLGAIGVTFLSLHRIGRAAAASGTEDTLVRIAKALRIGLVGFCIAIFFLSEQYNPILYMWMAMTIALRDLVSSADAPAPQVFRMQLPAAAVGGRR